MVRLLTLFFFLWVHSSFGQFPDSIVLRYDKGHYPFGSSGQYSISEVMTLSKTSDTAVYLQSHFQLKKSFDSVSNKTTVDTTHFRIKKALIPRFVVDKVLAELNTSKDNFKEAFVRPFLKPPSKKEILNIANKYDLDWMWKDSDREERKTMLNELRGFKYLDSFLLKKKSNPEYDMVVIDVWNVFSLTVFRGSNIVEYRSQFFELLGQPVKRYDNKDYSRSDKVINLEINNSIKDLLPANSLLRQAIDLNALKEEYIKWYFENIL